MRPVPGFDGTYKGTCAVCLQPTDTGLAFEGEAEWVVAGMKVLGIPEKEAILMISDVTGCDPGMVPVGSFRNIVRVCSACAQKAGMPVGLLEGGEIPCYRQEDQGKPPIVWDGEHQ